MTNLVLLHITGAFLSLSLLIIRGLMQLNGKDWRAVKPFKILPHLADTLLLVSGIALIFSFGFSLQAWLIAKFLCFVLYAIFAGKYFSRKTTRPNAVFFLLSILAFSAAMLLGYQH
ncbi:SirB2 family protein [Actinobacillus porcinus]|uniref:SirB2 family protein n=1 Tax=Actinobacillus porcinus TaxID=51048 RepID=UPI0023577A2E|nr:SirB2 family protein [Actinobacillus porcinus]MCI5763793.1 SirB2 family protein [Actinobacillus porcinus]MDY5421283.1 SirB2 family protein [Actinobacillus porcinus]